MKNINWDQDYARTAYWIELNGEKIKNGARVGLDKFYLTPDQATVKGLAARFAQAPNSYKEIVAAAGVTLTGDPDQDFKILQGAGEWQFTMCGGYYAKLLSKQSDQESEFARLIAEWFGGTMKEENHNTFIDFLRRLGIRYAPQHLYRALYIPQEQLQSMSEGARISIRLGPGTGQRVLFSWTQDPKFAEEFLREAKTPQGMTVIIVDADIPGQDILVSSADLSRWAGETSVICPPWWWDDPKYTREANVSEFGDLNTIKSMIDTFDEEKEWLVLMGQRDTFTGVKVRHEGEYHPLATPATPTLNSMKASLLRRVS